MSTAGYEDVFNQSASSSTAGGFVRVVTDDKVTSVKLYTSEDNTYKQTLYGGVPDGDDRIFYTNSTYGYSVPNTTVNDFYWEVDVNRDYLTDGSEYDNKVTAVQDNTLVDVDNVFPSLTLDNFVYPSPQETAKNGDTLDIYLTNGSGLSEADKFYLQAGDSPNNYTSSHSHPANNVVNISGIATISGHFDVSNPPAEEHNLAGTTDYENIQ